MTDELTQIAAAAIAALEALPPGVPYADALTAATDAVSNLETAADDHVIVHVEPIGADLWSDFEFYTSAFKTTTYPIELATLHGMAIDSHPKLARLLRSGFALERVRESAAQPGLPVERPAVVHRQYLRLCARDLQGRAEFEPWATLIFDTIPALEARLEAARVRHEPLVQP